MKHTPLADAIMSNVNNAFNFIDDLKTIKSEVNYGEQTTFFRLFQVVYDSLCDIEWNNVKEEFWSLSNSFNDQNLLIRLYKAKFGKLLQWNTVVRLNTETMSALAMEEVAPFIILHEKNNIILSEKEKVEFSTKYLLLLYQLYLVKQQICGLLDQCEALVDGHNSPALVAETCDKVNRSGCRLASKRKTDFIKILSAMYDTHMFTDEDGEPVTNKQKLMEAFGEFLGDDFSSYSTLLSQSKVRDEKTFMKPFKDIEKAAKLYFVE